ncbi:YtxH domain-containing protein [Terribacillus sp. FSL K6-0262]|uniref:YtxH domain-containing protein n=1 Tax=Terribacillus TaxID=459532 RepID=UPI0030ECC872
MMANGKSIALGILVGSTVSAAITLLTAPSSGKELRADAKQRTDEWKVTFNNLKNEGTQLKEQIARTSKEGAAMFKELSAEVKTSIESWKRTVEPHQKNIQKSLSQIEKTLKELEEKANQKNSDA